MPLPKLFLALFVALASLATPLHAFETAFTTWLANGPVRAALTSGSTLYIGGDFYQIGPYTGGGALVDATTGAVVGSAPDVNGSVYAVLADGSGGWYLGGNFLQVAGVNRASLAHLLADGTTDPNFVANLNSGGEAYKLYLNGSTLYVAGLFTTVNGTSRVGLAALNKASGSVLAGFDAGLNSSVFDMIPSGTTLYIGGFFTTAANGAQTRNRIAQVNQSNGSLTSFNPDADQRVSALLLSGSTLYAGGRFSSIGGKARDYLAALDASGSTGWAIAAFDAAATTNTVTAQFQVYTLALSATSLVVGGNFYGMGGLVRPNLAALDAGTGVGLAWDPACDDFVYGMTISAGTVYVGGEFRNVGNAYRNHLAALDLASNNALPWDPNAGAWCWTLAPNSSGIFVGGTFRSLGGVRRENLAAVDAASGTPTAFDPGLLAGATNSYVHALALSGTTLYFGGEFDEVAGSTRNHLAAVDAATGALLSFDPNADNTVQALAVSGTVLYAGGDFANIGGQPRNRIAGLNTATGLANAFDPNADASVLCLAAGPNRIYAGGNFANIGGLARPYLGALDPASGAAYPGFNPDPNNGVLALLFNSTSLFVGGSFTQFIGGTITRNYAAALEPLSGTVQAFDPNVDGNVNTFALNASTLYLGGNFSHIGGASRINIGSVNASSGQVSFFTSSTNGVVNALANIGSKVFVGGSFTRAFGYIQYNLSAVVDNQPTPTPTTVIVHPNEVAAYPQPASDRICFSAWADAPGELTIDAYNLGMQHVARFKGKLPGTGQQSFCETTGSLAPGVYYYQAVLNGQEFPYQKFWIIR